MHLFLVCIEPEARSVRNTETCRSEAVLMSNTLPRLGNFGPGSQHPRQSHGVALLLQACYCGRMPKLKYDLTGQVFGLLTALHHVRSGDWLVRCACGTEKVVMGQSLRLGKLKSCGCAYRGGYGRTHGKGERSSRWKGDNIRYSTAHRRVTSQRGAAREHPCSGCGGEAQSWAYRGGSSKELVEDRGPGAKVKRIVRYSPDPADYDPMCWSCHVRKDLAERP